MPDEIINPNGATPADGSESGQATEPQTEEVAASPSQPQAVTLEQVQALLSQALAGTKQEIGRTLQSQLDKRDAGLRKQIEQLRTQSNQIADAAKATGIKDEQARQLGQAFFNAQLDGLMAAEQQQPGKADGQGNPTAQPGTDEQQAAYFQYVTQQGDRLRRAVGLDFADPEMKHIVTDQGEQAYFDSIEAAGNTKRERLKREAAQGRPSRSPGLGADGGNAPRNAIANITDPDVLYELAEKKAAGRR